MPDAQNVHVISSSLRLDKPAVDRISLRSNLPDSAYRECDCPLVDGVIRHHRGTCTDPVAARLDWYADDDDD